MIIEKWKQSHALVMGKDHQKVNLVCQDRTYYEFKNGTHVIALADGAGSRKRSELGALVVTKTICELLSSDFFKYYAYFEKRGQNQEQYQQNLKTVKRMILNELMQALQKKAMEENLGVNELSSTLLFFAYHQNKYMMGHIGDGVIGGLFEEDDTNLLYTLSEPENGGAPNITFFVTDTNAFDHLRLSAGELNNLRGIILMSDGPAEVMYSKKIGLYDNVHLIFKNFYKNTSINYSKVLQKFLAEKISTYSNDDLSLNILYLEQYQMHDDPYTIDLLKSIKNKSQISFKSQYSIIIDASINKGYTEFSTVDEVRRYINETIIKS